MIGVKTRARGKVYRAKSKLALRKSYIIITIVRTRWRMLRSRHACTVS